MPDFPQPDSCLCSNYEGPVGGDHLPMASYCDCAIQCAPESGTIGLCCPNQNYCVCVDLYDYEDMGHERALAWYCDDPMGRCCMWFKNPTDGSFVYLGCSQKHRSECNAQEDESTPAQLLLTYNFAEGETCAISPCVAQEAWNCCMTCRYDFPAGSFPDYIHSGKVKEYETVFHKSCTMNISPEDCENFGSSGHLDPWNVGWPPGSDPPPRSGYIKQYLNSCTSYPFQGTASCADECDDGWYDILDNKLE